MTSSSLSGQALKSSLKGKLTLNMHDIGIHRFLICFHCLKTKAAYCTYANQILNYNKRCLQTKLCHIAARFQVIMTLNYAVYTLDKHHVDIATPYKNIKQWEYYLLCFLKNISVEGFQCNLSC